MPDEEDELEILHARIVALIADPPDDDGEAQLHLAADLLAALARVRGRVEQTEAAQSLLLEAASANVEFMSATNDRLDALERASGRPLGA